MVLPRPLALAALLVAASTLVACGDDDDDDRATPTTTTTTVDDDDDDGDGGDGDDDGTTTTTGDDAACASPPDLAADPIDSRTVDIDGDGEGDEVTLFADAAVTTLTVDVRFGAGGGARLELDDVDPALAPARIDAVVDIEGDGDLDVWATVGSGASTDIHTLLVSEPCALVRPTADGAPNAFPAGGSVGNISGVECTDIDGNGALDGFLVHAAALADDGTTYQGTTTHRVVSGTELTVLQTTPLTAASDSPDFGRYGTFACG